MAETLNTRIRDLRKEKGMTQLELAEKLGITDKAVSKWESGDGNPDISLLPAISSIFDVSIDYLLTGKKEEDRISLDDMDSGKRFSYLVKKDDAENFKKYGYVGSIFGRERRNTSGKMVSFIEEPKLKEILDNHSTAIFRLCCDEFVKRYEPVCAGEFVSISDLFGSTFNDVVKFCVELDRVAVVKLFLVKYLKLGESNESNSSRYRGNDEPLPLSREVLEYFFERRKSSPKCYEYITNLEFSIPDTQRRYGRNGVIYVETFLENDILDLAIKHGFYDSFEKMLAVLSSEAEKVDVETGGGWFYRYDKTYVTTSGGEQALGRIIPIKEEAVKSLIRANQIPLAKKCLEHNALCIKKITQVVGRSSYERNPAKVFQMSDFDLDRYFNLNRTDISDDDKLMLECVNNHIIVKEKLLQSRDLKFVRKVLDNNYYHFFEFALDGVINHKEKELFKALVDAQKESLARLLMQGEMSDPGHKRFIKEAFDTLNKKDAQNPLGFYSDLEFTKTIIDEKQRWEAERETIEAEITNLFDNKVLKYIRRLKEGIYESVASSIAAEKQAKADQEEREKIIKELPRSYFEGLLKNKGEELFVIKLCALFDAILKFDLGYQGEDFHERMKAYFDNGPKSRDCDDGWGYMVPDTDYEESTVKPWNAKRDLFNRLRMERNNIAHAENNKIQNFSDTELEECMKYVFSLLKSDAAMDDEDEEED